MRKNVRADRNEPLISFQLNDTADVIIKPSLKMSSSAFIRKSRRFTFTTYRL